MEGVSMRKEFQQMLEEGHDPVCDFTAFVDLYLSYCSTTRDIANIIVEDILCQVTLEID